MSSKNRIGRPRYPLLLTHGASATTKSSSGDANGMLRQVIILAPAAVDASATFDIAVIDSDTNTIYSKTGLAAASKTLDLLTADTQVPLSGTYTVKVTFSAAQTATDTTTTVILLVDRG